LAPTPIMSVIDNGLDLVFFFAFDQIRWRPREVGDRAQSFHYTAAGSEAWKHVVDAHDKGERKLIGHRVISLC